MWLFQQQCGEDSLGDPAGFLPANSYSNIIHGSPNAVYWIYIVPVPLVLLGDITVFSL